jgi:hypothetical protein
MPELLPTVLQHRQSQANRRRIRAEGSLACESHRAGSGPMPGLSRREYHDIVLGIRTATVCGEVSKYLSGFDLQTRSHLCSVRYHGGGADGREPGKYEFAG